MTRSSPRTASLSVGLLVSMLVAALGAACGSGHSGFGASGNNPGGPTPGSDGGGPVGTYADGSVPILGANDAATKVDANAGTPPPPACSDVPCACALAGGTYNGTTCTIVENPGNVGSSTKGQLSGGGSADSAFAFLYPYDQTVFPRGLLSPTLQFGGTAPDAMLVHIHAATIDYQGWFGASNPGRAQPSANAWLAITLAATGKAPLTVDVTKESGGNVTGPVTETWTIAQGSLRGIIYYETYGSTILGGFASVGIMKIAPGATTPVPIASGCGNVCHTASADGSTLVSSQGFGGLTSVSYDLKNGPTVRKAQSDQSFIYGGLFPNGSVVMSSTNYRTWFGGASHLYDTTSGTQIAAQGWDGTITNAAMPAFSPDGTAIVFNHEDTGDGHSLATMLYDAQTRAFSGLTDIASDPSSYLGWPAFSPDVKSVVYHAGSNPLFETDADNEAGVPSTGDLYVVDLATKQTARLDAADGYSASATSATYLPAKDPDLNFAPTMLPEAVGGYFWIVFTSHRSYGNTLPSMDNGDQNGKLWVAAFDIGATPGTDPSHPAFYLDGQESGADNLRGFWVADPCAADGSGCSAGDQCCGGYCNAGACSSTAPSGCAAEYDKCGVTSDCCSGLECIDDKCALPPVK